jgi:octaprenyl-diphosphate synthase
MLSVEEIMAPISLEMNQFDDHFKETMRSKVPLLDKVTQYIVKRKGKQMRPMFVFLTAKMLGEIGEKTYDAASLVELLHTATLVHDDVVDDANERRGYFSVNALWKNKIAVLVGDYMLSRILLLSLEKENTELLKIVARSVREMSEGELLQIEKTRRLDITEDIYFEIIKKKTASLIATCCEAGAISVGANTSADTMYIFGELVGIAFQIKDDIFDYGSPDKIGKPTGIDIREQKMTLPFIYAINNASQADRKVLTDIVKYKNDQSEAIDRAIEIVIHSGGIKYAHDKMLYYGNKALDLLTEIPDSEAKKSLIGLVNYTMNREK